MPTSLTIIKYRIMAKRQKITHFHWKNVLKNNFLWVFGHVWTQFFMLVNFSSTLGTYWIFLGQNNWLIFHPLSTLISLSGWLPKAITAPWRCSLRVQWCNTFQLGPKKPPRPLLPPKKFQAPNPKSQSQPSVHWTSFNRINILSKIDFFSSRKNGWRKLGR